MAVGAGLVQHAATAYRVRKGPGMQLQVTRRLKRK